VWHKEAIEQEWADWRKGSGYWGMTKVSPQKCLNI
jgi:hypothetical protein